MTVVFIVDFQKDDSAKSQKRKISCVFHLNGFCEKESLKGIKSL